MYLTRVAEWSDYNKMEEGPIILYNENFRNASLAAKLLPRAFRECRLGDNFEPYMHILLFWESPHTQVPLIYLLSFSSCFHMS